MLRLTGFDDDELRYPRNPRLDPQLVWIGKDAEDREDLMVDAPPIHIQERIEPRVLIENLRPMPGQPGLVEHYRHESWTNRMILGDSLQVMGSLAEREGLRGQVQMIYLDPPYGIEFGSERQRATRAGAVREAERVMAYRDTWELGIHSYLSYVRDRLVVARDLLTESGSVFVQIGEENVHLVRTVLDEVFGRQNFVSLISFATTSGFTQASALGRNGDYLVWFAKNRASLKSRPLWMSAPDRSAYKWLHLPDGTSRGVRAGEDADADARRYAPGDLQSQGSAASPQPFAYAGRTYLPRPNSHWKANYPLGVQRLAWADRIHVAENSIRYRRYADDFPWQARTNLWTDTGTGNFTGDKSYVVQTNTKVVERCILLATDPGDLVLDPTCGSGTTAQVAEQWGRRWITIDTSRVALALARQRLITARYPFYLLADSADGRSREQELGGTPLPRGETDGDVRCGFVYERARRITLKSIANNPDIAEGMTRDEIEAAIGRHAEVELLHDRPIEDRGRPRVAGPFTVESLSPHRALDDERLSAGDGTGFEAAVLENLQKGGIQNGRKAERLEFVAIEPAAGRLVRAIGERRDHVRVAIAVGPQFGTVASGYVEAAAKEAIAAGLESVAVLGFAFDQVRRLGRPEVLLVRMNPDLLMTELKKTGAGNLFTIVGEPDLELIRIVDGRYRVQLRGVDGYDPNTGRPRDAEIDQIALWMIDTDYDEESFVVRHCYFTGGGHPYRKLQVALKAKVDADAWAGLYGFTSVPFDRPASGRIAVKVINDYGDDVTKVIELH